MEITNETKVTIGILVATVLVIAIGAFLSTRGGDNEEAVLEDSSRLVSDSAPAIGPDDAKVTVVEFGDFECPACGALHPALSHVKNAMKDKSVKFVYRNYPLPQHPNADLAAQASVAAQAQGKFWEYHDLLFENQKFLKRDALEDYAKQLDLDMDLFNEALDSGLYKDDVKKDIADGNFSQVRATPSLFINGVLYEGAYGSSSIVEVIEKELQS